MRGASLKTQAEIVRVRKLQCDVAQIAAGKSAEQLKMLEQNRISLEENLTQSVSSYRESLASNRFDPVLSEGWRAVIEGHALELDAHDAQLDEARDEARQREGEWNRSRGQHEIALRLERKVVRTFYRKTDEVILAASLDLLLARKGSV